MKANKALKRLAKIETLMSDVAERFSVSAPHLREALKDLKAAVLSVKEAVKVQTSSAAAKKKAPKKAARAGKKAAAPVTKAKTAKKRAPARKAAKKAQPKPAASAGVHAAAAASPEAMPASDSLE